MMSCYRLFLLRVIIEANTKVVLCFLFVFATTAGCDVNLCPRFYNCTCVVDNVGDKIQIKCRGISRIASLSKVFEEIDFRSISEMRVMECSADWLPDNILTNLSIDILHVNCPFQRFADRSLPVASSLTWLDIRESKFLQIPQDVRRQNNLRSLQITRGRLTAIGDGLRNMSYLTHLSLHGNRIETVAKDAFVANTRLAFINLSRNVIKAFHPETFEFCRYIRNFSAAYNRLEAFPGIIRSHSLTRINLRGNGLKSIQEIFQEFHDIKHLNIGENRLLDVTNFTFPRELDQLQILEMDRCKLGTLPAKLLERLTSLENVDLSFNGLHSIPYDFFRNLINLKIVDLRGNRLTTLQAVFKFNRYLEVVYLSRNHIKEIGNAFQNGFSLKRVELATNKQLKAIRKEDFEDCTSLQYLKLNSNRISRIDKDAFINLKQLRMLNLNSNKILTLNDSVRGLQRVEVLSLRSNRLEVIAAQELFGLNHLKDLDLSNNKLQNVNGAFKHLVSLSSLNLRKNKLKMLPRNSFPQNIPVQDLWLTKNKWICDCRLLWLQQLYLNKLETDSRRHLRCFRPKRFQTRKITDLSTEELVQWSENCPPTCRCTCIPENDLFYVKVDCSDKGLVEVPSTLPEETGELLLPNNTLTNPISFKPDEMTYLRLIDLEGNRLETLDFVPPQNVEVLKLAGNKLSRFFNSPPPNVSLWTLSNNPWICDCETKAFRNWLLSNQKLILDINSTRCGERINREGLQNKVIVMLSEMDLCPSFVSSYVIVAVCILTLLLLGTSSRLIYSRYHYHMKVFLYSRGIVWLKKAEDTDVGKIHDAFISAADQDLHLVKNILIELESKEPHYTLFEPRRDMRAGEMFQFEKEMEEVTKSKRVIILLSENYINNQFLMEVFKVAFLACLKEKLYRLILIVVGNLPSLSNIDGSLKAAIESSRCLRFEQMMFWEMLRFAMPISKEQTRAEGSYE